jgi:hypothetical protein
MAGFCEQGDEPSGSIKKQDIFDIRPRKECSGTCTMEELQGILIRKVCAMSDANYGVYCSEM